MKTPTVYETNRWIIGWPELEGQLCQLEYLPTERSRKWRKSSDSGYYSVIHLDYAVMLMKENNWHSIRFTPIERNR